MAGRSLFVIVIAVAMVAVVVGHAVPSPIQVYWETVLPNTPILEFILSKFEPEVINEKTSTSMGGTTVNVGNEASVVNREMGVGRKGVRVNIGRGKSGVQVDQGGVNVNTSPKAKAAIENAQPGANLFNYNYDGERGVTSPKKAVIENVQPAAANFFTYHYDGEGGAPEGKPMIENVQLRANLSSSSANHHHDDPNVPLFFFERDLHQGAKFIIFFPNAKPGPKFLPRNVVDAIPFLSANISEILTHFSIDPTSLDAQIMMKTIKTCEVPAIMEAKFCATSLESMIDFATSKLGTNIKALTTEIKEEAPKQQYTIAPGVREKTSPKSVSCHIQAYVHAVYYCHETSNTATYVVPLVGEDKMKFDAVAVCHRDTSQWNPKHVAFQMLKVKPGSASICHFIPKDHIVWVQNW